MISVFVSSILAFALIQITAILLSSSLIRSFRLIQFCSITGSITDNNGDNCFIYDPELFWRLAPNKTVVEKGVMFNGVVSNSMGFRNVWNTYPEGELVAALGDSSTFGYGIPVEETWPAQLENLLRRHHETGNMSVINAGVPGYTSFQGSRILKKLAGEVKPSVVIAMFGWNDGGRWGDLSDREHSEKLGTRPFLERFVSSSDLKIAAGWIRYSLLGHMPKLYLPGARPRVNSHEYRDNMLDIVRTARSLEALPILVAWPLFMDEDGRDNADGRFVPCQYLAELKDVCDNTGTPLLDMYPAFSGRKREDLYRDMGHASVRGYRELAEGLEKVILEQRPESKSNK